MSAEIRIELEERRDKDNKKYLFGSIPFLNMVIFVRERNGRTHASLRPYTPRERQVGSGLTDSTANNRTTR